MCFKLSCDHLKQFYTAIDKITAEENLSHVAKTHYRPGAQPALHFEGVIFMKSHSMTSSYLSNCGTTFSQTVTYNNNVFLPADTKSMVYKHPHSAQRWLIKTERFTTALEGESPVSSEISDITSYTHAQNSILHINNAEKNDD